MSPGEIEILLHYWCCPTLHPRADIAYVGETLQRFIDAGLFVRSEKSGSGVDATEGCKVLVDALCAVPFPVQRWVMP